MVAEKVFLNCYNFNPIRVEHASMHKKNYGTQDNSSYLIKQSGAGAGAGAAIRICGSEELELEEIFSASQHCF
jgi:hypothetical protein